MAFYKKSYTGTRHAGYKTSYSGTRHAGYERAMMHIAEGEELSRELGGTDKDVKAYFFSLQGKMLRQVLEEYGKQYGADKRAYAEQALPYWKSGTRQMSGLVASRLFSLLPAEMPIEKKFAMVESLWKHCGKSSNRKYYVGKDANPVELTRKVRCHFEEQVQPHSIDETISRRFKWLAQEDSTLHQQLKNHFLQLERDQLTNASFDRIGILINQFKSNTATSRSIEQEFQVGKHTVNLIFNDATEGISDTPPLVEEEFHSGWLIFIIIGIIAFLAFAG
jgi:hypothetical protein